MLNRSLVEDIQVVKSLRTDLEATQGWQTEIDVGLQDPRLREVASLAVQAERERMEAELAEKTAAIPVEQILKLNCDYMAQLVEVRLEIEKLETITSEPGVKPDEEYALGLAIEADMLEEQISKLSELNEIDELSELQAQSEPQIEESTEESQESQKKEAAYVRIANFLMQNPDRIHSRLGIALGVYVDDLDIGESKLYNRVNMVFADYHWKIELVLTQNGFRLVEIQIPPGEHGNKSTRNIKGYICKEAEVAGSSIASRKHEVATGQEAEDEPAWVAKFRQKTKRILAELKEKGFFADDSRPSIKIDDDMRRAMRKLGELGVISVDQAESIAPDLYTLAVVVLNRTESFRFADIEDSCDTAMEIVNSEIEEALKAFDARR